MDLEPEPAPGVRDPGDTSFLGWILGAAALGTGGVLVTRNRSKRNDSD